MLCAAALLSHLLRRGVVVPPGGGPTPAPPSLINVFAAVVKFVSCDLYNKLLTSKRFCWNLIGVVFNLPVGSGDVQTPGLFFMSGGQSSVPTLQTPVLPHCVQLGSTGTHSSRSQTQICVITTKEKWPLNSAPWGTSLGRMIWDVIWRQSVPAV